MNWNFQTDKPYFVIDPEGDGVSYFKTQEDRDKFANLCIEQYLDDSWDEEVVNVVAGIVTHSAQQVDRRDKPQILDEDGLDEEGTYWDSDHEFVCNYKLLPLKEQSTDQEQS